MGPRLGSPSRRARLEATDSAAETAHAQRNQSPPAAARPLGEREPQRQSETKAEPPQPGEANLQPPRLGSPSRRARLVAADSAAEAAHAQRNQSPPAAARPLGEQEPQRWTLCISGGKRCCYPTQRCPMRRNLSPEVCRGGGHGPSAKAPGGVRRCLR